MGLLLLYFILAFVATVVIGMLASGVDRKVTARIQARKGPPIIQPFYDFAKLMGKEVMVPESAKKTGFLLAPLLALAGVSLAAAILIMCNIVPSEGAEPVSFVGDIVAVIYLLMIPPIAVILGASASGNPLASLGASREMKLLLAYELPFIIAIVTVIWQAGSFSIGDVLQYQQTSAVLLKPSGIIAFIVILICIQAKLTLVPFDIPEADQEIATGVYIEYSGAPLALFKLTRAMMLFAVPAFVVTVFMGGFHIGSPWMIWGLIKYVLLLVLTILLRNTNPRLRIDQAVKFFWGGWSLLAVLGLLLAIIGH